MMPSALVKAEQNLDEAELEFERRAFSPFWEYVESALVHLGTVYESIDGITYDASEFTRFGSILEDGHGEQSGPFPVANVDTQQIREVADNTRVRLDSIVRLSQTDFQFSTIYEQRKTNAILMRGFQTLGQAITGLHAQLISSFDSLSTQLEGMERGFENRHARSLDAMHDLQSSISLVAESAERNAVSAYAQREAIAVDQAKLAEQQLAMLDNIQRHRRPLRQERGPRLF